jgi:uncharacterized protein YbjT (DUF2867 family)
MRLLVTGGTGVLGRALWPLAEPAGHEFAMPRREELDLFDPSAVADVRDVDGVLHLATRIRPVEQITELDAWRENDRLRADAGSSSTRRSRPGRRSNAASSCDLGCSTARAPAATRR